MKKVSTIEMSKEDVQAALLMFLQKSGEDLGTEVPAIVLTSSGKGKGCDVTASVTLSSEIVVAMGDAGSITILPSHTDAASAFKKPVPALTKSVPKEAAALVLEIEQKEKTTQALDVADMGRTLKEEPPVEIVVEEEESPFEEEVLVEEEIIEVIEEAVEVAEEVEEVAVAKAPVKSAAGLFATKETVIEDAPEKIEPVQEQAVSPANTKKDNLFG